MMLFWEKMRTHGNGTEEPDGRLSLSQDPGPQLPNEKQQAWALLGKRSPQNEPII